MKTLKFIYTLLVCSTLFACSYKNDAEKALDKATQLLETKPDSSLAILDSIRVRYKDWSKSQRMQYELIYAQAQNKAYIDFTTDSIVLSVAEYYNNHGSDSERMLANYMVGCAYRDLGDAPSALKYMNLAVEAVDENNKECNLRRYQRMRFRKAAVDENNKECNLRTLMNIHSQMGGLYQSVCAFENEQAENSHAEKIAWQIGDTISALHMMWFRACNLYDYRQTAQSIDLIDSIAQFFHSNNIDNPYLIYPLKIEAKLKSKDVTQANQLLTEYEQALNISPFSTDQEITDVTYFKRKGLYYLLTNQADSALQMFQRLLDNIDRHPQFVTEPDGLRGESYRGLMEAYSLKHLPDSAIKYARLYCMTNDSLTQRQSSEQLLRMQSLYNYTKIQEKAIRAEHNAYRLRISIILLTITTFIVILLSWQRYQKNIKEERHKQMTANLEYQRLQQELKRSEKELQLLRSDSKTFIEKKEIEIQKLHTALKVYQSDDMDTDSWNNERAYINCDIAKHLHNLSTQGKEATQNELDKLSNIAKDAFPEFYNAITNKEKCLSEREIITCVLIRFQFIPSEIAVLTNHSYQSITNIKTTINKKLFQQQGAKSLEANLKALR